MANRVVPPAGAAMVWLAAALLLVAPSPSSAQRWRFGIGAAGAYNAWSPAATPSTGGDIGFDPALSALGDATLWLAPSLGLRLDGSLAQPDLHYRRNGQSSVVVPRSRVTTAQLSLLVPAFGARPLKFLRTQVLPYIALGGGVTMIDPNADTSCPVTGGADQCGAEFTANGARYLLERTTQPSLRAAFGIDLGLGEHSGLRFEVGDRVMRSPVVGLTTDAGGNVVRDDAPRSIMHGAYASLGLQLHTRNQRPAKTNDFPLVAVGVGGGSAPVATGNPATVGSALDKLAGSPRLANRNRPAPVSRAVPIDSAKPRAIGKDSIYDVVLDIPNVSIDEITLEVNNIHAHVSLDAKVAKLVELAVGADAGIDRVYLGIRGVQAEAHLKVDLDNVATIVDRVLTTIDRNPEIITGLLETLETTVNTVGNVANNALAPNGVVAQTVGTVGQIANTALQPGGVVTDLVNTVGSVANTALAPNGVVAQTVGTLGNVANTALAPNGVVAQTVGTVGDIANTALAPNGVLAQTVNTVGNVANTALQPNGVVSQAVGTVGDIANNTLTTVGGVANTALQPGGVVSNLTTAVGGAVQNLTAQGGLLSPMGVNALGQTVARVVDASGQILVRATDAAGRITGQNVVGNVLQLPALQQSMTPSGIIQRVVRDVSGSLIAVFLDNAGRVLGTQVLQQAAAAAAGAVLPQGLPREDDDAQQQGEEWSESGRRPSGPSASLGEYDAFAYPAQQIPLTNQAADTGGVAPKLLVLAATIDDKGEMVQRYVEASGLLMERTINPSDGRVTMVKRVGNVFRLPLVAQRADPGTGALIRTVREPVTGATIDLTFGQAGKLERIRLDQMGTLTGATMATAAVTAGRTPASPPPTAMPGTLAAPSPLPPNALPTGALPAVTGTLLGNVLGNGQPAANAPLAANAPNAPLAANAPLAVNAPLAPLAPNAPLAANASLAVNAPLAGNLPNAGGLTAAAAANTIMPSLAASAMVGNTGLNLQGGLPGLDSANVPRQTTPVDPDTTKPLLLLSQRVNDRGQIVVRVVDLEGKITERSLNAAGQLVIKKGAANARLLPLVREYVDPKGQYVRLVKDTFGAILELDFSAQGKLFRVRVLNRPDADVNGAAAAAANLPSAIAQAVNGVGQLIQHVVLTNGSIVERLVDRAGNVIQQRAVGSVLNLPALIALAQPNSQLVIVARDPTGALLEIVMRASDRMLLSLRTLDTGAVAR